MASYKLTYFNSRGRAETIRYILAAAEVEYEDFRIEKDQWPAMKASTPFGQLPVLEVDGVQLGQTNACARYLARKFNLAGKTELDQARADMLVDCFGDSVGPLIALFTEKDEAKQAEIKKKYIEEQLPAYLTLLEALLTANHGGDKFFVGDELTWTDLVFLNHIDWMTLMCACDPLANHSKLAALKVRVEALPKIAAWLEKRPKTER
jgi:glutathione S-transferase